METSAYSGVTKLLNLFRSYLRGMETTNSVCGTLRPHDFDPTYEAWKQLQTLHIFLECLISILPTRHGNRKQLFSYRVRHLISILPTRHGNEDSPGEDREELYPFRSYLRGMETVFCLHTSIQHFDLFRSYLRGMETFHSPLISSPYLNFDPTYEAWKPVSTLLIPFIERISILPTRHGNLQDGDLLRGGSLHFDPTYEAWKL